MANEEICTEHLHTMALALKAYQRDHDTFPSHLQDLCSKYVADPGIFRCPSDRSQIDGPPLGPPVSYAYEMSAEPSAGAGLQLGRHRPGPGLTLREYKLAQQVNFGDRVPVVRCYHHGEAVLNLSPDGKVYQSQWQWEFAPDTVREVLFRVQRDLVTGGERFSHSWSLDALEAYFTVWPDRDKVLLVDTPLPPSLRYRLAEVGEQLASAAISLPASSQQKARYLAARFFQAAGQMQAAITTCEEAQRLSPGNAISLGLLDELRYIQSGKRGNPPIETCTRAEMARRHIPGLSIAVMRSGKVVFEKGLGLANPQRSVPATSDTVYEIASMTKTFTAAGVLMLVQESKISLDNPISTYLVESPDTWRAVTVRNLLSHTSGIPDWINELSDAQRPPVDDQGEFIRGMGRLPLKFAPGEEWSYCNTGFLLLGWMIERISGKPLEEFFDQRIFHPLGMTSTAKSFSDLAILSAGYRRDMTNPGDLPQRTNDVRASGSGMFVSTVNDLVKWNTSMGTGRLLRSSTVKEMWTPYRLRDGRSAEYGLGWEAGDYEGRRRVGHGGEGAGHSSMLARFPDDHCSIIVLANMSGGAAIRVAAVLSRLCLREPGPIPDPDIRMTRHLKRVLTALGQRRANADEFTDQCFAALQPGETAAFFRSLGPLRSFRPMERSSGSARHEYRYLAKYGKTAWIQSFVLTPAGKIAGLGTVPL